ncbi:MAG: hypothetical protein EXR53_01235 [Dehalococcoidia bacterium]|nr:hypothetical protein [Dehalococcoidia bacterium]
MVVAVVLLAVFAPVVTNRDPNLEDYTARLTGPSTSHWLGTDDFGRDLWTRMVYGARISLQVGFIAVFTGATLGLSWVSLPGIWEGALMLLPSELWR